MVYKKYIKRGDKLFGPYYYRSIKKDGKVITQYVKEPNDFPKKKFLIDSKKIPKNFLILPLILLVLIAGFFILKPVFTGKATLSVENSYVSGENLFGGLKLNLEPREFIPASTKVLIKNDENKYEFFLSDLIDENPSQGKFYVSGANISGFGEGYGVNEEELEVSFTMNILSESKKNDDLKKSEEIINETEIAEIKSNEEVSEITEEINKTNEEIIEETIPETEIPLTEETQIENPETTAESSEIIESEITGGTILNFFNNLFLTITGKTSLEIINEVSAKVSKDKPFVYVLENSQTAKITKSDKKVNLEIINNSAVVSTEYSGEGVEYLINLSELNIPVKNKDLEIKLVYNGTEFYSINKNLDFESLTNLTIQEVNFTTDNSTTQYGAILGEPVKWKKKIIASESETIIELPKQAENISIYQIENPQNTEQNITLENLTALTGNLILEYKSDRKGFFSKVAKFITGRVIEVTEKQEKIEVNISENGFEYQVEYVTPAPISFEKNTSSGKEVIISSEVHYENILAYTSLPENTNLKEIKLYQIVNGSKIPVDFIAYNVNNEVVEESNDLDDDVLNEIEKIVNQEDEIGINKSLIYGEENENKLDYSVKKIRAKKEDSVLRIEWIVPSLSNQTYEIILISKAEHLDSSRNFISNIYEQVKALDNNWSEQINDSEYVRVTFEKNLTNVNDITIYARSINNKTSQIEVYESNKTELIAEIKNISSETWYQVFLNKLNTSQNVFDLKVVGGSVEFDYIVDPIILGNANSLNTNTTYENNFTHLNVSNSSIKLYMPFDENVSLTTTYDYSDNGNDGTLMGGVIYNSSGVYGGAYTFDGVDDYINVSDSSTLNFGTGDFSVGAWIEASSYGKQLMIVTKDIATAGYTFEAMGNRLRVQSSSGAGWSLANSNANLVNGSRHYVLFVRTGATAKFYIDGVDQTNLNPINSGNLSTTNSLKIGTYAGLTSNFNGSMDEIMIWNTSLTATEVLALYNNQTNRFYPTGTMNWTGVNFAGNDTINITLAGCQQNQGSSLKASVNDGAFVAFDSSCFIKDYNATGNLNSANVTIQFLAGNLTNPFYSPLVIGNLSLDSRDVNIPNITINLPTNNSFSSQTNLSINFTAQSSDLNTCWYSNDSYTANTTLTNCNTNITTVQWSEGQHNVTIWVNDTANSVNSSMVTFTIDTTLPTFAWTNPTPADKSSTSANSTYLNVTITDATQTSAWFDWNKSLVGYWSMDVRNSTGVFDNSTYNNFGTSSGAVYNSSGMYGGAYTFDGVNDVININYPFGGLDTATTGTWSAWIYTNGGSVFLSIGKSTINSQIMMQAISGTNVLRALALDETSSIKWDLRTTAGIGVNTWTHVVLVQNNTSPVLYVNGVAVAQSFSSSVDKTIWLNDITGFNKMTIGANAITPQAFYNGSVDEVMIFDRALSSTEILAIYNNSANRLQNNFTSLSDGLYNYSAYSIDKAGNLNITSPDRQITLDTTFPTLTFANPTTNSSTLSQNFIQANLSFTEINLDKLNISLF
ncbi:MAG: LamG domain-containing protein, partial [Nanoarchaeota archaeon]